MRIPIESLIPEKETKQETIKSLASIIDTHAEKAKGSGINIKKLPIGDRRIQTIPLNNVPILEILERKNLENTFVDPKLQEPLTEEKLAEIVDIGGEYIDIYTSEYRYEKAESPQQVREVYIKWLKDENNRFKNEDIKQNYLERKHAQKVGTEILRKSLALSNILHWVKETNPEIFDEVCAEIIPASVALLGTELHVADNLTNNKEIANTELKALINRNIAELFDGREDMAFAFWDELAKLIPDFPEYQNDLLNLRNGCLAEIFTKKYIRDSDFFKEYGISFDNVSMNEDVWKGYDIELVLYNGVHVFLDVKKNAGAEPFALGFIGNGREIKTFQDDWSTLDYRTLGTPNSLITHALKRNWCISVRVPEDVLKQDADKDDIIAFQNYIRDCIELIERTTNNETSSSGNN